MKEIRKIIYMDRIFLISMLLFLMAGSFWITHDVKRELRTAAWCEEENREWLEEFNRKNARQITYEEWLQSEDDADLFGENVPESYSIIYIEKIRLAYRQIAVYMMIFLTLGFYWKWILQDGGRKKEFTDSLPIKAINRTTAQIMEVVFLSGITTFADGMKLAGIQHSLLKKYPTASVSLRSFSPDSEHVRMCLVVITAAGFSVLLAMLLHMLVRSLLLLPAVWWMIYGFFEMMTYVGRELNEYGIKFSIFGKSRVSYLGQFNSTHMELSNSEFYPWNLFLLIQGKESLSVKMTCFLILIDATLIMCLLVFSGKKDCAGQKIIALPLARYLLLILFAVEVSGLIGISVLSGLGELFTFTASILLTCVLTIAVSAGVWYFAEGRYRKKGW